MPKRGERLYEKHLVSEFNLHRGEVRKDVLCKTPNCETEPHPARLDVPYDVGCIIGLNPERSSQRMSNWRKGKEAIPRKYLNRLADLFGCDPDYLCGRTIYRTKEDYNRALAEQTEIELKEIELSDKYADFLHRQDMEYDREVTDEFLGSLFIHVHRGPCSIEVHDERSFSDIRHIGQYRTINVPEDYVFIERGKSRRLIPLREYDVFIQAFRRVSTEIADSFLHLYIEEDDEENTEEEMKEAAQSQAIKILSWKSSKQLSDSSESE